MKVAGIVAEYNPFHNGHKYQINALRESGAQQIVVAMSGNFVQRGEAAIFDKWVRTETALLGGADLVVEIPTCYCVAPAEKYAFGAVSVLNSLHVVDTLCFGSESGDLNRLLSTARALDDEKVNIKTKEILSSGVTFAVAREAAVREVFGNKTADVLKSSNDILATEYIRSLNTLKSDIKPFAIKRVGVFHDDENTSAEFASASKIREMILNNENYSDFIPKNEYDIIKKLAPCLLSNAEKACLWQLRQMSAKDFERLCDVSEGFHNRIYEQVGKCDSLGELYEGIKTKRYTLARVKRLILCAVLSIFDYEMPPYIRVLGFSENGKTLLSKIKKSCSVPLVTSFSDAKGIGKNAEDYFKKEAKYTDFYSLLSKNIRQRDLEFTEAIVKK